jgi:hypothetical protein
MSINKELQLRGRISLTIHGVLDLRVLERDRVNGVVTSTTNATNRQTVSTGADTATESDILSTESAQCPIGEFYPNAYRSRVYSNTIILVIHIGAGDNHVSTTTNIETVCVMATSTITGFIVNSHIGDSESITAVDANSLNRSILDVKVRDSRRDEIMGIEELGLGNATVATFAVPPTRTIGVEVGTAGTLDGDSSTGDLEEWATPFLVSPGGLTFEDDL